MGGDSGISMVGHKCEKFVLLRSMNLKQCVVCKSYKVWRLNDNQPPLLTSSRDKGLTK